MAVTYLTENVKLPDQFKKRMTSQWIKEIIMGCGKSTGNIVYIFCDNDRIIEINRQYLRHDYYTDIITFDYSENDQLSGDIFISLDMVKANAELYNTTYQDEMRRVMIHGILHLCGFKDNTMALKKRIRNNPGCNHIYNNNIIYYSIIYHTVTYFVITIIDDHGYFAYHMVVKYLS